MVDWVPHSQNFRRFLRRWGIGSQVWNLGELLTGVLPTALVDRSWQDDELDNWGVSALALSPANQIPAILVSAGSGNDTYIRQIDVIAFPGSGIGSAAIAGQSVGVFTPEGGYDPLGTSTAAMQTVQFFPGLFNSRGFSAPQTLFFSGWNTAFQGGPFAPWTITLDFVLQPGFTQFWPARFCEVVSDPNCPGSTSSSVPLGFITLAASAGALIGKSTRLHSQEQPPMRIPAGQLMAIQLQQKPTVQYAFTVSILFQEQNAAQI